MQRRYSRFWILILATICAGCHFGRTIPAFVPPEFVDAPDSISFFADPLYAQRTPRRVLIVPAAGTIQPARIQKQFVEELAAQLRAAQLFEVVVDPAIGECRCNMDTILHGRFDEYRLLELADRYQADAILVTRVNRFQPVSPMQLSATCALIDKHDAIVMAATDGQWSLHDPTTSSAWESWLHYYSTGFPREVAATQLLSPRRFQSFAAWQMTRRLGSPLGIDTAANAATPPLTNCRSN